MRQLTKKITLFLLLLISSTFIIISPSKASAENTDTYEYLTETTENTNPDDTLSPRSDVIKWRYTTINGVTYRRLYNYTTGEWIGPWELAP